MHPLFMISLHRKSTIGHRKYLGLPIGKSTTKPSSHARPSVVLQGVAVSQHLHPEDFNQPWDPRV